MWTVNGCNIAKGVDKNNYKPYETQKLKRGNMIVLKHEWAISVVTSKHESN